MPARIVQIFLPESQIGQLETILPRHTVTVAVEEEGYAVKG